MIKMLPIPKQHPIHSQDYYYYFTSYLLHYPCILIGPSRQIYKQGASIREGDKTVTGRGSWIWLDRRGSGAVKAYLASANPACHSILSDWVSIRLRFDQ